MSHNQAAQLAAALATKLAQDRLTAQNKEAAKVHLLRIQLLLARRPIPSSKP